LNRGSCIILLSTVLYIQLVLHHIIIAPLRAVVADSREFYLSVPLFHATKRVGNIECWSTQHCTQEGAAYGWICAAVTLSNLLKSFKCGWLWAGGQVSPYGIVEWHVPSNAISCAPAEPLLGVDAMQQPACAEFHGNGCEVARVCRDSVTQSH